MKSAKEKVPRVGGFYCSLTPLSVLRLLLLYYTTSSSAPPTYHHNNVFATEWQEEILVQRNEIRLDELSWGIMDSKMISETALNDCTTTTSPTNWNYSITNSRNTIIYINSSTKYSSFLFVKLICEWVSLLRRLSVYIKKLLNYETYYDGNLQASKRTSVWSEKKCRRPIDDQ